MKEKKALILSEVFYPEEFVINDLVNEWEMQGYQVEVLTRVPSYPFGKVYKGFKNKLYQTTYFNSVKIHRVPVIQGYQKSVIVKLANYFAFMFWTFWAILFIGKRYDRVFIFQSGPLTMATAGILMKKLFKTKVTIWTQDLWPDTVYAYGFKKTFFLSSCLDSFVRWIYKNCDSILVSCEGFIEKIHRYVSDKEVVFIPNWSIMDYTPQGAVSLPGKFNFTFAGNIGKVQNLDNVVLGFGEFVKTHPHAWLNIIGNGSFLEELKLLIKQQAIPNVNCTGRIPMAEMADYYEASDVLIISLIDVPLYETMVPSKFQAYLAAGKPIFAIFNGEIRIMVEKYGLGLGAKPTDVRDIATGYAEFVHLSPEEFAAMINNCTKLHEEMYNREKIIEKLNTIFWA